jgi:hypothetical protein
VAPATDFQSPITPASTPQPATSNGVVTEAALQNLISWPNIKLQSLFAASTPGAATSVGYPSLPNGSVAYPATTKSAASTQNILPTTTIVPNSTISQVIAKEP